MGLVNKNPIIPPSWGPPQEEHQRRAPGGNSDRASKEQAHIWILISGARTPYLISSSEDQTYEVMITSTIEYDRKELM